MLLSWIEQLYGSKEPVDPGQCTIEHVMPQSLTPTWRAMLAEDLGPEDSLSDVYDSLLHTLGNLTLTGYNSSLGNKSFTVKRAAYKGSAFLMNQEIAKQERWGRPEILARADALADPDRRPLAGTRPDRGGDADGRDLGSHEPGTR